MHLSHAAILESFNWDGRGFGPTWHSRRPGGVLLIQESFSPRADGLHRAARPAEVEAATSWTPRPFRVLSWQFWCSLEERPQATDSLRPIRCGRMFDRTVQTLRSDERLMLLAGLAQHGSV